MRRWRGLLDERAGLEGDTEERSDVSPAQGFTRGDGAGQHHRALSTLGIFVLMGVGGFSARVLQGSIVVCHHGFGRPLDHRFARRAADRGDVGPGRRGGRRGNAWNQMPVGGRVGTRFRWRPAAARSTAAISIRLVRIVGKGGMTSDPTAYIGSKAAENPVHVHDLGTTILYLMVHRPREAQPDRCGLLAEPDGFGSPPFWQIKWQHAPKRRQLRLTIWCQMRSRCAFGFADGVSSD